MLKKGILLGATTLSMFAMASDLENGSEIETTPINTHLEKISSAAADLAEYVSADKSISESEAMSITEQFQEKVSELMMTETKKEKVSFRMIVDHKNLKGLCGSIANIPDLIKAESEFVQSSCISLFLNAEKEKDSDSFDFYHMVSLEDVPQLCGILAKDSSYYLDSKYAEVFSSCTLKLVDQPIEVKVEFK